ncbi:hypothetical protein PUN28_008676 [Cardiocondyla obscurior]|uniref:Uncharacterized protein n=1 Tax=Cardiocondyla obscurior TaxID=286306 RepID=A0AAW2G3S7_9HYME
MAGYLSSVGLPFSYVRFRAFIRALFALTRSHNARTSLLKKKKKRRTRKANTTNINKSTTECCRLSSRERTTERESLVARDPASKTPDSILRLLLAVTKRHSNIFVNNENVDLPFSRK